MVLSIGSINFFFMFLFSNGEERTTKTLTIGKCGEETIGTHSEIRTRIDERLWMESKYSRTLEEEPKTCTTRKVFGYGIVLISSKFPCPPIRTINSIPSPFHLHVFQFVNSFFVVFSIV